MYGSRSTSAGETIGSRAGDHVKERRRSASPPTLGGKTPHYDQGSKGSYDALSLIYAGSVNLGDRLGYVVSATHTVRSSMAWAFRAARMRWSHCPRQTPASIRSPRHLVFVTRSRYRTGCCPTASGRASRTQSTPNVARTRGKTARIRPRRFPFGANHSATT